ncbi:MULTISPECIES: gamma carbonic anhydrase [Mammaliicoccus]|uniref:Gamma carbonic anhydrase family protein n=1 Tax=Mammaliicoccus sciuri TaxID=1296 RepID=A0AB37HNM1_MAMSC|nr:MULTISPECIES: gamma carbonic anhydrase family protein [Mammaliicoccus]MBF9298887.1 gamma carbonic anhydrase family protein [Staphylococcus schleiferi]MCS5428409.1 gamma carbonic anhydrase family protein [Staphylococcus aureus]MCE4980082.1 gamma carbonic anhydrase family protein [Mammaliicoccus sciuri]MCE5058012.1 gamma carbonic anhydrase family protein [Mammaliicoccus sciuri]MCE5085773.1 gamma carbonic anhydrase family protein [Mammaliicoccus sciuri]
MIKSFKGQKPQIDQSCYIAENATLTGDITIGPKSSVWFNSVIRGDVAPTIIGEGVNIQDLCCLHQSPNQPLIIEDFVTVGHKVTLHSSIIRKHALIGMDSTILDGAEIGEYAFIGAGSLVPPGKKIPPHTLAFGRPAKVIRELTEDDYNELKRINASYIEKAEIYKADQ